MNELAGDVLVQNVYLQMNTILMYVLTSYHSCLLLYLNVFVYTSMI